MAASYPLTVTQRFTVTRSIVVHRKGFHLLDAVERQLRDCAPDFDDPAWQADWGLLEEEVDPIDPPNGWNEVESYDPDYLDDLDNLDGFEDLDETGTSNDGNNPCLPAAATSAGPGMALPRNRDLAAWTVHE